MNILQILIPIITIYLIYVFLKINIKNFWIILIYILVIGNGPKLFNYNILDEIGISFLVILSMCILKGNFIVIPKINNLKFIEFLWISFCFYNIILSLIGIVYLDDFRVIRFTVFYLNLYLLFIILKCHNDTFELPKVEKLIYHLVLSSLILLLLYIIQGFFFENYLNIGINGRFDSQNYFWSGSSYTLFHLAVVLPLIFYSSLCNVLKPHFIKINILIIIFTGFYFYSRSVWVSILVPLFLHLYFIKIKILFFLLVVFLSLFYFFMPDFFENLDEFLKSILSMFNFFKSPSESDATRNFHFQAMLNTNQSLLNILFGNGIYTHRYLIAEEYYKILLNNLDLVNLNSWVGENGSQIEIKVDSFVRTTSLPALFFDSGLIGIFFHIIFFLNLFYLAIYENIRKIILVVSTIILLIIWFFISNILDIILLYLILMPRGLLWNFLQYKD